MASWFDIWFAIVITQRVTAATNQNLTRQQLYSRISTNVTVAAGDVTNQMELPTDAHCAFYCTSETWCQFFSVQPISPDGVMCKFTSSASPATSSQTGSEIFGVMKTPLLSSDCKDPQLDNSSLYSCNAAPVFESAAMLRMGSNRAIVFTTDNKYIKCPGMNNIVEQGAEYCHAKLPVLGDPYIDPNSDRFSAGPPDGAVGYIRSNMVECRYYLFKGNLVYCYQHMDSEPWMRPCTAWTSKTIQERFGDGIPSNIDDVFGNRKYNHDFYFIKDNIVYMSSGDSIQGSLALGYPKHVHDLHPNFICDVTGVQLGLESGEYYYTRGKHVFKESGGVVYYRRYLCN